MAVDLARLNENLLMPTGLAVQPVEGNETLQGWSQVCALGFQEYCQIDQYAWLPEHQQGSGYHGILGNPPSGVT